MSVFVLAISLLVPNTVGYYPGPVTPSAAALADGANFSTRLLLLEAFSFFF